MASTTSSIMPAMSPPPGQVSNFVDPPRSSGGWTAGIIVVLVLMVIILAMRFFSKIRYARKLQWDDWSALIAGILNIVLAVITITLFWMPAYGTHTWDVPMSAYSDPELYTHEFIIQILSPWASYFVNMSVLLFLLNIFPVRFNPVVGYLLYFGMTVNTLFYVTLTLYTGIQCAPRQFGVMPHQCSDNIMLELGEAIASVNMALFVFDLAVAIPAIMNLQMNLRKRVGVCAVLSTGLCATAISAVTLGYRVNTMNFKDPAWEVCIPVGLGWFENAIALIAACLPATTPVMIRIANTTVISWNKISSRWSVSSNKNSGIATFGPKTFSNETSQSSLARASEQSRRNTSSANDTALPHIPTNHQLTDVSNSREQANSMA